MWAECLGRSSVKVFVFVFFFLPESARSEARAREARGGPGEPERASLSETAHCCGLEGCAQQER